MLTGCGSTPPEVETSAVESPANYYIGTRPIYAHLEQGSGGSWILATVTQSDSPSDKGYLIRLNDLSPSFDVRLAECEPQAYPANHKCNPAQPFRDKQIGVMSKIISGGIAAGTAGKVTELSRTYKTTFDDAAFNQAVDEALVNTGLGPRRREFIHTLGRYDALLAGAVTDISTSREKAISRYRNTEDLVLDIRPTVKGLTDYYSADIDFRDLVRIEPKTSGKAESSLIEHQGILPCDAGRCAAKANTAMEELSAAIARRKANLDTALADHTSEYALNCNANSYAGYSFVLECPDTLANTGAGTETVPVTIDILSRDFDALYPQFGIDDENLSVEVDEDVVRFRNRTNHYLSVDAQSVYYNSLVQTQSEPIDIAPGVVIEKPIEHFVTPAIEIQARYLQMTPDKANRSSFQFGFAAKYRLAGAAEETTLYDFRNFNVGCVIDNRIRPGSCRYPARSNGSDADLQTAEAE